MSDAIRPPLPPFTTASATQKVRLAEDGWNGQNPAKVAQAYTVNSSWRNRGVFINGRVNIEQILSQKWQQELQYRLIKELWAYTDNRIAVRFAYEFHNSVKQWFRAYGNENWEFNEHGLMHKRIASINSVAIDDSERKFHWPLGRRPDNHPSLADLGL
ncbi:MAG: nuclear transport factor 2 (NTF2) superfamily protein [Pseudomonadales bacterium]|jgi:nuclear transport factor 2 (NTF2) superfamily protein